VTVTAMPQTDADTGKKPRGKGRLVLALVVAIAVLGAGAYFFVLKPSGPSKPEPGTVDPLDSIQINLAGGHYLRLGIALQLRKGATEIDGSKALDAAINLFSGQSMTQRNQGQPRNSLKTKLSNQLTSLYDGDVMGVYFTEFVTQ
jgi:flagellar FliL protein